MREILHECQTDKIIYNHCVFKNPLEEPYYKNLELHTHNSFELFYFIKGDVTFSIEDKQYNLDKHDLVFVDRGKGHYVEMMSDATFERYNLFFNKDFFKKQKLPERINCAKHSIIMDIFAKFDYFCEHLSNQEFENVAMSLLNELVYGLNIVQSEVLVSNENIHADSLITDALNIIKDNLFTIRSMSEVAEKLYISDGYFFRMFKSNMKISPKKYILIKRLQEAQKMLSKGVSAKEVCFACGFEAYSTFFKCFLDYFGCTPSECILKKDTNALPTLEEIF